RRRSRRGRRSCGSARRSSESDRVDRAQFGGAIETHRRLTAPRERSAVPGAATVGGEWRPGVLHISYSGTPISTAKLASRAAPLIGYTQASAAPQKCTHHGARRCAAVPATEAEIQPFLARAPAPVRRKRCPTTSRYRGMENRWKCVISSSLRVEIGDGLASAVAAGAAASGR